MGLITDIIKNRLLDNWPAQEGVRDKIEPAYQNYIKIFYIGLLTNFKHFSLIGLLAN